MFQSVLHRLIKESEGALELVDASDLVPGLKFSSGLTHWELTVKECNEFYSSFDQVPEEYHTVIRPQMFPPSKEDAPLFGLEKSMRILPHYQNTGGFFVAALKKTKLMPWERKQKEEAVIVVDSEQEKVDGTTDGIADGDAKVEEKHVPWGPQRKKRRIYGYKEDPFVFFQENEPVWQGIRDFYDIECNEKSAFKPTSLLTRSHVGKKKNLYFCSETVKHLVQANEENCKIINTGVKAFVRCDNRNMSCEFRLANEGLPSSSSVIGQKRRVQVTKDDLIVLLNHPDPVHPPELEKMSEPTRNRIAEIESGSCLLVYNEPENDFTLNVVGWRGAKTIRAYVDLNDSIHMLRLLGADVSRFEINKFEKKKELEAAAAAVAEAKDEEMEQDFSSENIAAATEEDVKVA